jgi:hypothetical protein
MKPPVCYQQTGGNAIFLEENSTIEQSNEPKSLNR